MLGELGTELKPTRKAILTEEEIPAFLQLRSEQSLNLQQPPGIGDEVEASSLASTCLYSEMVLKNSKFTP